MRLRVLPPVLLVSFICLSALVFAQPVPARPQEPQTASASQELDLDQYIAQLDRCSESLKDSGQIAQLRNSLPPFWSVQSGNSTIRVSTEPITSQLREMETHPDKSTTLLPESRRLLAAMRESAVDTRDAKQLQDSTAATQRLNTILKRREFQGATGPSAWDLLVARIDRWIVSTLSRLFGKLHISSQTGNLLAWGVMLAAFLALCYMVWGWITRKSQRIESIPTMAAPPSDARQWVAEALAAAERHDYREAIHCAYWAAIAKLEDINALTRDRARTPRESLRLLDRRPREQSLLGEMTGPFELIWYGYRPATAIDWSCTKTQLEKMGCLRVLTPPTANS